jgi:shikimate kinase
MTALVKPLVLVGPMGVGKTTVGKKLAKKLGVEFIDTDALVVKEHDAITKIFEQEGEEVFRDYEALALREALKHISVIATGGGVILRPENRKLLEQTATVIYLSTNGKHMAARLVAGKRPLLKNGVGDWRKIYEARKPLYEEVANFEIKTSDQSILRTVHEIVEKMNQS